MAGPNRRDHVSSSDEDPRSPADNSLPDFDRALAGWRELVRDIERGYAYTIYDYTNDLSTRDMLDDAVHGAPRDRQEELRRRIAMWDERFRAATEPSLQHLPGRNRGSTGDWWHRVPMMRHGEFEADLVAEGLIPPSA